MSDDNVKMFGLVNGMEIIGTIESEDDEKFVIKNALAMNLQQPAPGTPPEQAAVRLSLVPPTFFAPEMTQDNARKGVDIELYKSTIMFTYAAREDIHNQYKVQTGKIIIAKSPIIT